MIMKYDEAKKIMLEKYETSICNGGYKTDDGYIFSLKPKNWDKNAYVLDGFFKVKNDRTIQEYSPVMNPEEFKKAMKNKIE